MRKKILFCVLIVVCSECGSHERVSILGGLLSGAHEIGHKVHDVLGGLAHGALNVQGHLEVNHMHNGYHNQPRPLPPVQNNGGYNRPEKPTETIIVVVEADDHPNNHNHHGFHGQRPHGNGPPNHFHQPNYPNNPGYGYGNQNNGPWANNYKPPGYGHNPQEQPNFNGNPYNNNNGNFNQNGYGRPPSYNQNNYNSNSNEDSETKPPVFNNGNNQNNFGNIPASPPPFQKPQDNNNNGNFNQNGGRPPSYNQNNYNPNSGQNYGTKPPTFNGNNQNNYGNIPDSPPLFHKPQDGLHDHNKPVFDLPTKQPEKNPQYDVNKENANNVPTHKPDTNVNNNEHTSKNPDDDDSPLFVPLNPDQYHYGGDKIEVSAPKRETNQQPAEGDNESYPIDVRFGDQ